MPFLGGAYRKAVLRLRKRFSGKILTKLAHIGQSSFLDLPVSGKRRSSAAGGMEFAQRFGSGN